MTNKNTFYEQVLERVRDDYEAPHTIAGDLARDLRREVTEHEVLEALMVLANNGLVQAYRIDENSGRYVEVTLPSEESPESLWFYARS